MPIDTIVDFIKKFNSENKQVVFVGKGNKSAKQAEDLKEQGCLFEDLTNNTTIPELSAVIKGAEYVISIDTGTMHLAYAVGTPIIAVFYEPDFVKRWAPNPKIYKSITIDSDQTAENIYNNYKLL